MQIVNLCRFLRTVEQGAGVNRILTGELNAQYVRFGGHKIRQGVMI